MLMDLVFYTIQKMHSTVFSIITQNQLSLFTENEVNSRRTNRSVLMSKDFLVEWKSRIVTFQQQTWNNPQSQQTSLFELSDSFDLDRVDPFSLLYQPFEFYRLSEDGQANCIYSVVDLMQPLLLYIGETQQTPKKRWMNHYCRDYTDNYLAIHHHYKLDVAVNIGFWWDTPTNRKVRQSMELALIDKWRSPFNKENWHLYSQPFKKAGSANY
jgi:hypothetical protein